MFILRSARLKVNKNPKLCKGGTPFHFSSWKKILKDKISRLHFIKQAFFSMVCIMKWSLAILYFRIFSYLKNEMESLLCLVWDSYELFTLQISKCPSWSSKESSNPIFQDFFQHEKWNGIGWLDSTPFHFQVEKNPER